MMGRARKRLVELARNPGRVARRHSRWLGPYKALADLVLTRRRARLRRLAFSVPASSPELHLDEDAGFLVLPPGALESAAPLLARCRELIAGGAARPMRKSHLASLAGLDRIEQYPEFLDFSLDPRLLRAAAEYLGECPVLASLDFWHSKPGSGEFQTSQLYHRDLDDVRQFKVFLFVSDVDETSGPLTVLRADVSARVSRELRYRPTSGNFRITDAQIRSRMTDGEEHVLTGPSGTIVLCDTSRLLHYGSRVSRRDRYVVVVQYLTPTNFMRNPFWRVDPWPYAHLARTSATPIERAVLGEGV